MTDCPRAGKLFGCKFRPRFSRSTPVEPSVQRLVFMGDYVTTEIQKEKVVYVRDVCERCGKTVERVKA